MVQIHDKDYWHWDALQTIRAREDDLFDEWLEATEAQQREFLTVGARLLRDRLEDGTA